MNIIASIAMLILGFGLISFAIYSGVKHPAAVKPTTEKQDKRADKVFRAIIVFIIVCFFVGIRIANKVIEKHNHQIFEDIIEKTGGIDSLIMF